MGLTHNCCYMWRWNDGDPTLSLNFMYLLIEIAFAEGDRLTLLKLEVQSPLTANREKTRAVFLDCNTSIFDHHPGDQVWKGKTKFCFRVNTVLSLKILARRVLFAVGLGFF